MTDRREKTRSTRRLFIFAGILGLAAVALLVQLVRLTILLPAREGTDTLVMPQVERGAILDRQGRILAVTTRQRRISAWVPGLTNAQESASLLARTLGMDQAALLNSWSRHDGYVVVKRKVTPEEAQAITALKAQGKLAGVRVEDDFGRFYPQGRLASHVVGYVGADNVPWDGIEYTFNDDLAPQPVGTDSDTVFGSQVFLTIDAGIEYQVEKIARAAFEANKPDSLTILVMDSRSGEILAYCSLPDFDPNEFQGDSPLVDRNSLINRPLAVSYRAGLDLQDLFTFLPAGAGCHYAGESLLHARVLREAPFKRGHNPYRGRRKKRQPHPAGDHRILEQLGRRICLGQDRQREPLPHADALRLREAHRPSAPGGNGRAPAQALSLVRALQAHCHHRPGDFRVRRPDGPGGNRHRQRRGSPETASS